jgi:hypothetical protein
LAERWYSGDLLALGGIRSKTPIGSIPRAVKSDPTYFDAARAASPRTAEVFRRYLPPANSRVSRRSGDHSMRQPGASQKIMAIDVLSGL